MVAFNKLGNLAKAKHYAGLVDSDIGPGLNFSYFDSMEMWSQLRCATAADQSVTVAASAPGCKKNKKNRSKSKTASAPNVLVEMEAAENSSSPSLVPDDFPSEARETGSLSSSSTGLDSKEASVEKSEAPKPLQSSAMFCPICFHNSHEVCAVVPCGHTFCSPCAQKLSSCSICRGAVQMCLRLYIYQE
jgi:hypothetical protein